MDIVCVDKYRYGIQQQVYRYVPAHFEYRIQRV
jgi:hypothetical protein